MKKLQNICLSSAIFLFSQIFIQAQDYKGIVPLRSTCHDVEKILKIKACSQSQVEYESENEKVRIYLSIQNCEKVFQRRYDVPVGTVLGVIVDFKRWMPLEKFPVDVSKFKKSSSDTEIYYSSKERGIEISVNTGDVRGIRYLPPKSDEKLLCKDESKESEKKSRKQNNSRKIKPQN
jgi:hypothetical protein